MPVLEHLEPKRVFGFFEELCAIPHGSGNTRAISDWLAAWRSIRTLWATSLSSRQPLPAMNPPSP